jgi:hypothetical protein
LFASVVLLCFFMPEVALGQASSTEKNATVTLPFEPLPITVPSWQLLFRATERPGIRLGEYFFMDIPTVGAGLKYEFETETRENNGVETTELYHKFAEKIGFRSSGWIYNPVLCSFSATLEPELSQVYEEDVAGTTSRSNLFTPDYLLSATILDPKPYTLNLHAKRRELPSWAAYKGGYETRIHDFGGNVTIDFRRLLQTSDYYHGKLAYNHYDSTVEGFYKRDEVTDNITLHFNQQGSNLKVDFTSFFTDRKSITEDIESSTKTFDAQILNRYLIRENNRITLSGSMGYRNQELDTLNLENFRFGEQLYWNHRRNLSSTYTLNYNYQNTNGSDASNHLAFSGQIQHLLFDNLTTTAGAKTLYAQRTDGQEAVVDPYLRFIYTRPTPIGDLRLSSRWNYLLTTRDYANAQSDIVVQNELHTLSFSQDTFLKNYNVMTDTIIVTNTAGTIQYIEGLDYQIEAIGEYVSIRSLSLGDINNRQDVLVHYVYLQDSNFDDAVFSQQYNMSYTFWGTTTLQLSHSRVNQYIIDGIQPNILNDDTVNSASIHHLMAWSDTRLELSEYDRAADVNYRVWQMTQRFEVHPLRDLNLSITGFYGERSYNDQPLEGDIRYDSVFYGGALAANWRLNRRLSFRMEGFSSIREDDVEDTVNTGLRAGLVFNYRIWTARLTYELSNQTLDNETNNSSRLRNFVRFDIVRLYW